MTTPSLCCRFSFAVFFAGLILLTPQAEAKDLSYRVLKMKENIPRIEGIAYFMRFTDHQALYDDELSPDDRVKAYIAASDAGFTGFRFQLRGFSEDGTEIDPAYLERLFAIKDESDSYWMNATCDILGAYPDASKKFRRNAVESAAKAFDGRGATLFWIEGEDSAKLAKIFHKIQPRHVIAATEGGDIDIVSSLGEAKEGRPPLLVGALPAAYDSRYHTYVPRSEGLYGQHEAAVLRPIEQAPVTLVDEALTDEEKADGFHSIFDGKTLDGWTIMGPKKDGFVVKDGAITWNGVGGFVLLSQREYGDFTLRMQWRVDKENGNAGLFLRCPRANRMSRMGFECQMMGDHGITPVKDSTGAIYDVVPALVDATNENGEWNEYEITCVGPSVKVVLNGTVVQDIRYEDFEGLRLRKQRGFIGLQDHASPCAYRNIRIKELEE